jgi:pyrroloquinoline quinone biosynthesis protein D
MAMTTDTITPLDDACPRLAPHYLFRWEDSQDSYILLYPEGLIKLNLSAGEILKRCDGQSRVADIVAGLQAAFPGNAAAIADSVQAFVRLAHGKGWLRY